MIVPQEHGLSSRLRPRILLSVECGGCHAPAPVCNPRWRSGGHTQSTTEPHATCKKRCSEEGFSSYLVFPEFLCRCAQAQKQESLRKGYPGHASDYLHRRGGEREVGGRRGTSTRSVSPALRSQVSTFPSSDTYRFFFLWLPDVNSVPGALVECVSWLLLLTRHTSFFATLTCKCRTNLDKLLGSPNALLVVTSFSIRLLSLGTRFILSASVPSSVDPLPPPSPP